MIKVPEAFRTAPRVPPRDGRYPCTECGSRTWMAYRSGETKRGTKGVMPAPIRWCMYCKDMRHWSGRKIEEQKAWANHYSCLTCSSSTYRLRLWVSDGLTLTLPYAYCVTCDAVASRAIESRGERKADGVKKCAGCNASISDRYKWCSNCKLRQIYGHGRLGPPQRRVRAEEADVKRNCVECGEEYLPNSGTQRFCTECAAARLRTSRRKPPPKKKPANELEVEIDFSAAADDAGAAAALAAAAPPPAGRGRGRGRSRAGSRAVGALSLIALDAGGPGGPASPVPPPAFDASLPGALCRPAEFEELFPGAARPPAGADRGQPGGGSAEPAAGGSSGPGRRPGRPKKAAPPPPAAASAPRRPGRPKKAAPTPPAAASAPRRPGRPKKAAPTPPAAASAPRRPGRPKKAAPTPPAAASAPRRPGRPKKAAPTPPAARPGAGGGSGGSAGLRAVDDAHGRGRTRGAAPGRAGAAKGRSARAASGAGRQKKAAPGKKAAKGPAGRRS